MDAVFESIGNFISEMFASINWKLVRFFVFAPIIVPIALFLFMTYEWWTGLFAKRKVLFFFLSVIYVPLNLILNLTYTGWQDLVK